MHDDNFMCVAAFLWQRQCATGFQHKMGRTLELDANPHRPFARFHPHQLFALFLFSVGCKLSPNRSSKLENLKHPTYEFACKLSSRGPVYRLISCSCGLSKPQDGHRRMSENRSMIGMPTYGVKGRLHGLERSSRQVENDYAESRVELSFSASATPTARSGKNELNPDEGRQSPTSTST